MTQSAIYRGKNTVAQPDLVFREFTESLDPASVAANTKATEAFTVTGVKVGDLLINVIPPDGTIGYSGAWISADDQVTLIFDNPTASPIDAGAGSWKFITLT